MFRKKRGSDPVKVLNRARSPFGANMMYFRITDDFDLKKIADSGQCFRWEQIEEEYYRILHSDRCIYVKRQDEECYQFSCEEDEFDAVWRDYFDLQEDYRAIRGRIDAGRDPFLYAAAEHEKGIRILRQDPWEMLITFIISQNKNIPAIQRSVEMLCEMCGERKLDHYGKAYYSFPTPDAVAALREEDLKACRLGYRWDYVRRAAKALLDGELDLSALRDAEEAQTLESLRSLYGVGPKVANCVSLFGLHHINAFPEDVWIKRVLKQEYPEGYPFDDYSPYNGVYQQYMFAYYREGES